MLLADVYHTGGSECSCNVEGCIDCLEEKSHTKMEVSGASQGSLAEADTMRPCQANEYLLFSWVNVRFKGSLKVDYRSGLENYVTCQRAQYI